MSDRRCHGPVARKGDATFRLLDEMQADRQAILRPVADCPRPAVRLVVDHDDKDLARIKSAELDVRQRIQEPRQGLCTTTSADADRDLHLRVLNLSRSFGRR